MSEAKLIVSKKDFEEMKSKGITDESLLKPGTFKLRRRRQIATENDLSPANTKVQITIKIDLDILNYFKERASEPNAAPYQTQINNELRSLMENSLKPKAKNKAAKDSFADLIKNKTFIKAVAKELKKVA